MATEKRLSSIDAMIYRLDKGTKLVGNSSATFASLTSSTADHFYVQIAAKATTSFFPAALGEGDIYYVNDPTDVPLTGDDFYFFTANSSCDIKSVSYSASKTKVDVTTLCDSVMSYRMNKVDITGSLTAIYTTGGSAVPMDRRQDYYSNFLNVIYYDGTSTYTKTVINDTLLWLGVYLDESTTAGEVEAVMFLPIRLEGNSINVAGDSATEVTFDFSVIGSEYPQIVESVVPA
jgi:hypothetical protein